MFEIEALKSNGLFEKVFETPDEEQADLYLLAAFMAGYTVRSNYVAFGEPVDEYDFLIPIFEFDLVIFVA